MFKKRLMALALVLAMTITTLVGCGQAKDDTNEGTTEGVTEGATDDTADVADPANFVFDEQIEIEIPVYDRATEGAAPVADNYWTQWVQKEFGDKHNVKVTYVAIPRQDDANKFNMLLASGKAPDIIFDYDYPDMVRYNDMGALQPIDMEQVKSWAPTFYGKMEEKGILEYTAIDDQDVFIAATRPDAYNFVNLIRQDWLDELGLDMPQNLEEYEAALKLFKENKLGGEGTIPMTLASPISGYTINYQFRDFPIDEKELAMYSDLTVASLSWEPTKKLLSMYNRLYNQGLISPEFYMDADGLQMQADFISGKAGTFALYLSKNPDVIGSLVANDPDAKVSVLSPTALVPEGGTASAREFWPFGMIMGFNVDSSEEEVQATLMLLEWMSQEENLFTLQNGIEGVTYELDEAGLPVLSEYTGEERLNYNSNKDMYALVIEGKDYGSEEKNLTVQKTTFAPEGYEYIIQDSYDYTQEYKDVWYPDYLFNTNIGSVADNAATLLDKYKVAYSKLITASPEDFESLYESYSKDYLESGYQEILDERAAAYDAAQK